MSVQKTITRTVAAAAAVMLTGTLACVFLQVVFRYVLSRPLSWSEELARFLFAWSSMLGAAAGATGILAQGIDLLTKRFPKHLQRPVDVVARAATLIACSVLIIKGFELTRRVHEQTSSALGVRMSYVYAAVPAGILFLFIILAVNTYTVYIPRAERSRE
jgi:TRAP-type C4-dicarboxylate transport system permease small subunit